MDKVLYGNWATLIGRSLIGLVFVYAGVTKILGFEGMSAYIAQAGLPLASLLLVLTILLEFIGGLLLVVGYQARLAAFLLAGFTLIATLIFHTNFADQTQMMFFTKNLMILGGLVFMSAYGAGKLSVDRKLAAKKHFS